MSRQSISLARCKISHSASSVDNTTHRDPGEGIVSSEYVTRIDGLNVQVSKRGGGTLGKSYVGLWDVTVMNGPVYVLDGEEIDAGTPKTHAQVARIAADFASAMIDRGE